MNEISQKAWDEIGDIISSATVPKYDGNCQHDGCSEQGYTYEYPAIDDESEPPTVIFCSSHAKQNGFCVGCGGFFGGVESFDFSNSHFCDDCQREYDNYEYQGSHDDPMVDDQDLDY